MISDQVIVMNKRAASSRSARRKTSTTARKTRFIADFVGSATSSKARCARRTAPARRPSTLPAAFHCKPGRFHLPRGDETHVAIRTAYIDLAPGAANATPAKIRSRLFHGDFIQYIVDWPAGQLTIRRPPTEVLDEGAQVTLSFAMEDCVLLEG